MNPFLIGGIIGFGPALFMIWFSMRKYTWPHVEGSLFEDRKVFFMLAVGMVVGTIITTLERYISPLYSFEGNNFIMFILIFVVAFPFIEDMAKFVILNFKGYRGRFDSTFYGMSLGAGYSATAIIGYTIIFMLSMEEGASIPITEWLALIFYSICTCLIHVSVGATLGSGTGKNLGMSAIPMAVIPHIIFNMLMIPGIFYGNLWASLVILLPVTVLIYMGVHTRTVPESLPTEVQKEVRRNQRKRTR